METQADRSVLLPVVAIVGRPNVGKSTLFNALTRSRDALVADEPGLTRDRQYGIAAADGDRGAFVIIDTGGLTDESDSMAQAISAQALRAVEESDGVIFMVDGREGLTAGDEQIVARLRATGRSVTLAVNKTEGLDADMAVAEFHALGLGTPLAVSAAHRRGIPALLEALHERIPPSYDAPRTD